jgi:hypothetical protein
MPNSTRENAIWLEAFDGEFTHILKARPDRSREIDESGWVWFIPLHDGSKSIGIVMDKQIMLGKRTCTRNAAKCGRQSLQDFYLGELKRAPGVIKSVGKGTLRDSGEPDAVKMGNDQSYAATSFSGDHFRIAGDAGGRRLFAEFLSA